MPRKSIGETAMTDAERQARYRAARAAGKPVTRVRRALDHRGRDRTLTPRDRGRGNRRRIAGGFAVSLLVHAAVLSVLLLSVAQIFGRRH